MRNYERYNVTEGTNAEFQESFSTLQEALDYISERYGVDNVVDLMVQIDASGDDGEETLSYLEVYDMIKD